MHGYMNSEALTKSIETQKPTTGEKQKKLWKKGDISGLNRKYQNFSRR